MTTVRGAFDPAGKLDGLAFELTFARADEPDYGGQEIARILAAGRTPLVTVEPWNDDDPRDCGPDWGRMLARFAPHRIYVRFQHEPNGTWYPWGNKPRAHVADWHVWAFWMPANVAKVWCVNVSFPGSKPVAAYWPGADAVDVVALDGYARNGETPAELFRPTMEQLFDAGVFRSGKPFWIAETAAPRGRTQARYAEALVRFAGQQGIAAVCWFHVRKEGSDEADWRMTKAAQRAFLEGSK